MIREGVVNIGSSRHIWISLSHLIYNNFAMFLILYDSYQENSILRKNKKIYCAIRQISHLMNIRHLKNCRQGKINNHAKQIQHMQNHHILYRNDDKTLWKTMETTYLLSYIFNHQFITKICIILHSDWKVYFHFLLCIRHNRFHHLYNEQMKKNNKLAIHIQEDSAEPDLNHHNTFFPQPLRPTLPDEEEERTPPENHQQPQHPPKVIEFQEFLVEDDRDQYKTEPQGPKHHPQKNFSEGRHSFRGKRDFIIQIPEGKPSLRSKIPANDSLEKEDYKEPPAPSNKKSMQAKSFIFPTTTSNTNPNPTSDFKPESPAQPDVEELLRSFDKERQEFYRQKSRWEKELLVKEGQIEMLQKMLTGRISSDPPTNYQYFQSLILEKDLQISELLQRIGQLGRQLSSRAEELRNAKTQASKIEILNESLLHQIYMLEQKEANKKTTQQFYDRHRQKPTTPTARNWENSYDTQHPRYSGLSDIQQRIQALKNNRIEFQDRKRIKSQLNYTQPTRFTSFEYKPAKF